MMDNKDRNFDAISEHFAKKVYGGLKGEIRLAVLRRDLQEVVDELSKKLDRPLKVLDVGAGLAQISLDLAKQGHEVTVNDISENMLTQAQLTADTMGVKNKIRWLIGPYQELSNTLNTGIDYGTEVNSEDGSDGNPESSSESNYESSSEKKYESSSEKKYDLILCHALLEWLAEPKDIFPFFKQWLAEHGVLSLCFYNPASFVYRNLIMGNFNLLNNPDFKSDNKKSLTPNNPVKYEDVESWLKDQALNIKLTTGLRVFHDYAPLKRGGHTNPEAVIEMELKYSEQEPYKWLGRYLHVVATR